MLISHLAYKDVTFIRFSLLDNFYSLEYFSNQTYRDCSIIMRAAISWSQRFNNCKNVNDLFIPGKVDEKATQLHAIASLKVISRKSV